MSKLRTLVLIVEMDDGICYQALLSKTQESAIRSVLAAIPGSLEILENPLELTLERPKVEPKEKI